MTRAIPAAITLAALTLIQPASARQSPAQTPEAFFGFRIGTDGELARYPRILEYLQHLATTTDRLTWEEVGKTTMGNPYVLAIVSAPENLKRLERLVEINRRLADPRGLSEAEAQKLAAEGRAFYFLYATIHSTEVGNTQALTEILHRLTTGNSPEVREILENVVLLVVPSQNPDGQYLVIDHWYGTRGTRYARVYPDLYHKYVGHDDNRDWFMFTQVETRLAIAIQNRFKPHITHDMHQMGPAGARMFVPPFDDPYDPNIHPILAQGQAAVGQAMASALVAEGKGGIEMNARFDLWTPARQYMVYHGQPRILTEIASVNLADPYANPAGPGVPLGPQEPRWNYPLPYKRADWTLRQIVEYGSTAAFAGLAHLAKYRTTWLENFYRVHADWVNRTEAPYAFVIPAGQRDPYEARELLRILRFAEVEVHRASGPFSAGGRAYPAGSWVVRLAQPYGSFAKTMLERQRYPDLRLFPGGPPKAPYDVTAHTLGLLMGVEVVQVDVPFEADLVEVSQDADLMLPMAVPGRPGWAYLMGPESNAAFMVVAKLQASKVPVYRSAGRFESGGRSFASGTWIVPATAESARIFGEDAPRLALSVAAADRPLALDVYPLRPQTRIGLWRGANNMPGGWMKWLFEQYGFHHRTIASMDFQADLGTLYDAIVLPPGISRETIVKGLDPSRHPSEFAWAYGVGEAGWTRLADWVRSGGTLVAIGSAVETARALLDLPIEPVLPGAPGWAGPGAARSTDADRVLREAFTSPARLHAVLRERVLDPATLFYCPGSLLQNEFNPSHPVAFGMPAEWPVFFESDQAYRLKPGFDIRAEIVARYPASGTIVQSGWLLGEDLLRDQANVLAFRVGRGYVVTAGTQIAFRTQPHATFKLLFNAVFSAGLQPVRLDGTPHPGK
ncbi:MAG TPA: M14 family metallopeptidase [Vicinamibacterales bacterium]|nr:M14 family metallopeptidase [Vicinamibacterales bacterium]